MSQEIEATWSLFGDAFIFTNEPQSFFHVPRWERGFCWIASPKTEKRQPALKGCP